MEKWLQVLLSRLIQRKPWRNHQEFRWHGLLHSWSYFSLNISKAVMIPDWATIQKPSPDAVPKDLPGESSEVDRCIAWQEWFRSHCFQYYPQAWQAWLLGKLVYPVSPTAKELALFIEDRNYIGDKTKFSVREIMGFVNEWVKDNLTRSRRTQIRIIVITG